MNTGVKYLSSLSSEELNQLPYGAILLDNQQKIIFYNSYEEKISGRVYNRVLGKDFFAEVAPCTNVASFRDYYDAIILKRTDEAQLDFVFNFNPPMQVHIKMIANRDNDTVWILVHRESNQNAA